MRVMMAWKGKGRERKGEGETEERKQQCAKGKQDARPWGGRDAPARYINSLGDKKRCYFWFLKPSVR